MSFNIFFAPRYFAPNVFWLTDLHAGVKCRGHTLIQDGWTFKKLAVMHFVWHGTFQTRHGLGLACASYLFGDGKREFPEFSKSNRSTTKTVFKFVSRPALNNFERD